ncbi:Tachykinin-like peptides receptor 99D [Trichoplax sp. H2]|nr:Tachykinin-like peptides receptor 99D [Trichoplax sp. H2]|eukprot:RDD42318.1 Tachykinin-like peptides receptor 99D [Trichoplax sp. H2]
MNNSKPDTAWLINVAHAAAVPLSILGLLANIYMFYILLSDKIFFKTSYYLVRVCVISDIISNVTSVISYSISITGNISFNLGNMLCKMSVFTILFSYGISILTISLVSADRYMAIMRPLSQFYRVHKIRVLVLTEMIICCVAILVAIPSLFIATVYPSDVKLCDIPSVTQLVAFYFVTAAVVFYFIPGIVLIVCYSRIIIYMRGHVQPGESFQEQLQQLRLQKKKYTKAFITIASVSLLVTWPFWVSSIALAISQKSLLDVKKTSDILYALIFVSFATTTAISVVNPLLYLRFDGNIREKSGAILRKFRSL